MDIFNRFLNREPKIVDPVDQPIPRAQQPPLDYRKVFSSRTDSLHKNYDGFGDPLHTWVEKRLQAIEATCTECGVVELHRDHAGRLKGAKTRARTAVSSTRPPVTAADRAKRDIEWKAYYEGGMNTTEIAALYEVTRGMVVKRLNNMGVTMRPPNRQKPGPDDAERTAEMLRLRSEEYLTYEQIGAKFGVSRERVRQILKQGGADNRGLVVARNLAVAKVHQPPACPRCHEPYGAETWLEHRNRLHPAQKPEHVERDRLVAADYTAGMKTADICAKYDIEPSSISRAIERHGVPKRRPNSNFLKTKPEIEARKAAILADVKNGMKNYDIAAKYSVSSAWVSLVARAGGIELRKYRKASSEEKTRWVLRYQTGLSAAAVARESNRAGSSVYKHLKAAGVLR